MAQEEKRGVYGAQVLAVAAHRYPFSRPLSSLNMR